MLDAGRGDPSDTGYGHGEAVRQWRVAEGAPDVTDPRKQAQLPTLSAYDPRVPGHGDAVAAACGHTDYGVRQDERGRWFAYCSCGYRSTNKRTDTEALSSAVHHIGPMITRVVAHARSRGLTLAAACEYERRRNAANNGESLRSNKRRSA